MSMLDRAYRRVSDRHGGLTVGQMLDYYGHEVKAEIDNIMIQDMLVCCVGTPLLLVIACMILATLS